MKFSIFCCAALLGILACATAHAQSDYLGGRGFPYAAFDRLPSTPLGQAITASPSG